MSSAIDPGSDPTPEVGDVTVLGDLVVYDSRVPAMDPARYEPGQPDNLELRAYLVAVLECELLDLEERTFSERFEVALYATAAGAYTIRHVDDAEVRVGGGLVHATNEPADRFRSPAVGVRETLATAVRDRHEVDA